MVTSSIDLETIHDPTDDVVAHLMLMRGDEHMFWRRANQHPPGRPEAAI